MNFPITKMAAVIVASPRTALNAGAGAVLTSVAAFLGAEDQHDPLQLGRIDPRMRDDKSQIKSDKHALRFPGIFCKVATDSSPMNLLLSTAVYFLVSGFVSYLSAPNSDESLTNMSLLLSGLAVILFLTALVSAQISASSFRVDSE